MKAGTAFVLHQSFSASELISVGLDLEEEQYVSFPTHPQLFAHGFPDENYLSNTVGRANTQLTIKRPASWYNQIHYKGRLTGGSQFKHSTYRLPKFYGGPVPTQRAHIPFPSSSPQPLPLCLPAINDYAEWNGVSAMPRQTTH